MKEESDIYITPTGIKYCPPIYFLDSIQEYDITGIIPVKDIHRNVLSLVNFLLKKELDINDYFFVSNKRIIFK